MNKTMLLSHGCLQYRHRHQQYQKLIHRQLLQRKHQRHHPNMVSIDIYLHHPTIGLMSYLCYLCLFTYCGVRHVLTTLVTWRGCYKRQEMRTIRRHLGLTPFFSVSMLFIFFCVVLCLFFCFVRLRPVFCVPNVASVSGLSILDCPFGFLERLYSMYTLIKKITTRLSYIQTDISTT